MSADSSISGGIVSDQPAAHLLTKRHHRALLEAKDLAARGMSFAEAADEMSKLTRDS